MKKIILFCFFSGLLAFSVSAQVTERKSNDKKTVIETPHSKTKIKKTSTPKQKVHNIIHPRRKHYSGVRTKHKTTK